MKQAIGICAFLFGWSMMGCLDLKSPPVATSGGNSTGSTSGGPIGSVIQEWTADEPGAGVSEYTLPSWLHIQCNSDNRTSQSSPNTLARPYGPNAARPRNVGLGWGLAVESRRRNQAHDSDSWSGTSWQDPAPIAAMTQTLSESDPAGTKMATKFATAPNTRSRTSPVPDGYATSWFRTNPGAIPIAYFIAGDISQPWKGKTIESLPEWTRLDVGVGKGALFIDTAGNGQSDFPPIPGSSEVWAYAAQLETDGSGASVNYPSSYIPTGGNDVARDPDELWSDAGATLLPDGYFHVVMKIAPHYSNVEGSSTYHHLLFANLSNQLRIELKESKIAIECAGSVLSGPNSGTLAWSRETELTIEAKVTPAGRYLKVSGADSGNFEVSDSVDRPWPAENKFYILGDSSGPQEGADLRYIGFKHPN